MGVRSHLLLFVGGYQSGQCGNWETWWSDCQRAGRLHGSNMEKLLQRLRCHLGENNNSHFVIYIKSTFLHLRSRIPLSDHPLHATIPILRPLILSPSFLPHPIVFSLKRSLHRETSCPQTEGWSQQGDCTVFNKHQYQNYFVCKCSYLQLMEYLSPQQVYPQVWMSVFAVHDRHVKPCAGISIMHSTTGYVNSQTAALCHCPHCPQ